MSLFVKKDLAALLQEANDPNEEHAVPKLRRTLGAWNLISLGIGAIIGAGIFSLTGTAAADYAGPGIIYSFVAGGVLCALAGLCYAEMAAMIPIAGSAYTYGYATMGEIVAWIIGWDLVLEYGFSVVTVASAWSGYAYSLLHKTFGIHLPDWAVRLTKGPWEEVTLVDGTVTTGIANLPAAGISALAAWVLIRGVHESASVNNLVVLIKVAIVVLFVALGLGAIDPANLFVNPNATGLAALVPAPEVVDGAVRYGWFNGGVLTGAGVVFFSYIGFDAVSTTAQEAKDPQRDLPIGILGSLVACTILYILVALVLTGVVPYRELGVSDPIAVGIDRIATIREWPAWASFLLGFLVKVGALAGLTSVILVSLMGQTRVFYAMARDGLLPWFDHVHPRYGTPDVATWVTGAFATVAATFMPMSLVGELVSIGTLLAFCVVCACVPILRVTQPDAPRPFKVARTTAGATAIGVSGALACLYVMSGLPGDTWLRLLVWLIIGFVIYFSYGRHHSVAARRAAA